MQLSGMLDSPYVRRVAISLQLLGLRFEHQSVSVFRTFAQFRQINPVVKAPTLICDDAAVLMEVIEHLDPPRLPALERTVFAEAAPATVVVTTPNVEHNVRFAGLPAGAARHRDHRFEWTRAEFQDWASGVASRNGYQVRFLPVGVDDPEVGPPTQLAVFSGVSA